MRSGSAPEIVREENGPATQLLIARCVAPLMGVLNSLCVFLIGFSKIGVLVGLTSVLVVEKGSWYHSDRVRLPMFAVAIIGSVVNLTVLWNAHQLRNAASARWRRRPLSASRRMWNAAVLLFSVIALMAVAVELWVHPPFHS